MNSKQVATVLTAKGRIAAATYRITFAHTGYSYSMYFTMGREMPEPQITLDPGGSGPLPNTWFLELTRVHA